MGVSLGIAIAGVEAEETLREYKEEAQKRAKQQSGSKRVVAKGGVLTGGEATERIRSRCLDEVQQARVTSMLRGWRGNPRKAFKRKLDFMAELDNPHRSAPREDRAVSI